MDVTSLIVLYIRCMEKGFCVPQLMFAVSSQPDGPQRQETGEKHEERGRFGRGKDSADLPVWE